LQIIKFETFLSIYINIWIKKIKINTVKKSSYCWTKLEKWEYQ